MSPRVSLDTPFDRDGAVEWKGAQRAVLGGDVQGHVALEPLATRLHLYGLGPLEGLRGEVTIAGGLPSIATIIDGEVRVERAWRGQACFLVVAEVPRWHATTIDVPVQDEPMLDAAVRRRACARGLRPGCPLPFLIQARAERLDFHVLDKRDGLPHNPERHEQAKARFALQDVAVEIVGFRSDRHRGIFTPGHSTIHMHMTTADGKLSGHVDTVHLAAGWTLSLPAADPEATS